MNPNEPITFEKLKEFIHLDWSRKLRAYGDSQLDVLSKANGNFTAKTFLKHLDIFNTLINKRTNVKYPVTKTTAASSLNAFNGALRWVIRSAMFEYPFFKDKTIYCDEDIQKLVDAINKERFDHAYSFIADKTLANHDGKYIYIRFKDIDPIEVAPIKPTGISNEDIQMELAGKQRESFEKLEMKIREWIQGSVPGDRIKLGCALEIKEAEKITKIIEDLTKDTRVIGKASRDSIMIYHKANEE